jgi:flagellar motor switch protein FliN/FliY
MATQTSTHSTISAASALLGQGAPKPRASSVPGGLQELATASSGGQSSPGMRAPGQFAGVTAPGASPPDRESGSATPGLAVGDNQRMPADTAEGASRAVAVRVSQAEAGEAGGERGLRLTPPLERMPVGLSVSIPVRDFRVRKLLAAKAGELIETQWGHGEDLPLSSGDVQLAWCEFEVVDTRLAVRVTRLA